MVKWDEISIDEGILICYALEHRKIGNSFTLANLKLRFPFFKYLMKDDEYPNLFESLLKKGAFIKDLEGIERSYSLVPDITESDILRRRYRLNYIQNFRQSILDRIPLEEFAELEQAERDDPTIPIFSNQLALGGKEWWKHIVITSSKYASALIDNEQLISFVRHLCSELEIALMSIDETNAQDSWIQNGFMYFKGEIDNITPWNSIQPCIFLFKASGFDTKMRDAILGVQHRMLSKDHTVAYIYFVLENPDNIARQIIDAQTAVVKAYPEDLKKIMLAVSLKNAFRDHVKSQIDIRLISPYQIMGPVSTNFFFGRDHEIRTIVANKDANYVIYGSRRIGKTSLLKKLHQIIGNQYDTVFVDCEGTRTIQALCIDLSKKMGLTECKSLDELSNRVKDGKKRFAVFLDEFDAVLNEKNADEILQTFRALSNEGYLRFIATGYKQLHKMSVDLKSPMYNFMNSIKLGFLSEQEAKELALYPMLALGVAYDKSDSTLKTLIYHASSHPNLVQVMCHELVLLVSDEKKKLITEADIKNVYYGQAFARYVDEIFFNANNLSKLEKLIVLMFLRQTPFREEEIYQEVKKACPFLDILEISSALENLVLSFVMEKNNTWYKYPYDKLPDIIRHNHNVDPFISSFKDELKQEYEKANK